MKTKEENKMVTKKITIELSGQSEYDCDIALDEAVRLLKEGYTAGHNSNESGSYSFFYEFIEDKG